MTATPQRRDGKGFQHIFDELIPSSPIRFFIEWGVLSPVRHFATHNPRLEDIPILAGDYAERPLEERMRERPVMADLVKGYLQHAKGKKCLVFAVSVRHAREVAAEYNHAGISAGVIDATTDSEMRDQLVDAFRRGDIRVLCNVEIFTEGFDCPDIEVVQIARPTKSLNLYLQMAGRVMRMAEGKECGILLDNASLWKEHGLVTRDRIWTLQGSRDAVPGIRVVNVKDVNRGTDGQSDEKMLPEINPDLELAEVIDTSHHFQIPVAEENVHSPIISVDPRFIHFTLEQLAEYSEQDISFGWYVNSRRGKICDLREAGSLLHYRIFGRLSRHAIELELLGNGRISHSPSPISYRSDGNKLMRSISRLLIEYLLLVDEEGFDFVTIRIGNQDWRFEIHRLDFNHELRSVLRDMKGFAAIWWDTMPGKDCIEAMRLIDQRLRNGLYVHWAMSRHFDIKE